MKNITDDDLVLLFYGEHDNLELAAMVAESKELSARFDALHAELSLADAFVPPSRGEDYGAEIWQQISPRLEENQPKPTQRRRSWLASIAVGWTFMSTGHLKSRLASITHDAVGWTFMSTRHLKSRLASITQPRFSLAGALSFALVAVLAFTLGRNGGQEITSDLPGPLDDPAIALAGIDSNRLLTHSVSGHLEQVNLVLTQFVNSTESNSKEAEYATDMLVANRLYRQAAASQGKHKLAAFLADLEPLLIELAYEAQSGSRTSRERMQKEVRDGLLFRVRVMNKQLAV